MKKRWLMGGVSLVVCAAVAAMLVWPAPSSAEEGSCLRLEVRSGSQTAVVEVVDGQVVLSNDQGELVLEATEIGTLSATRPPSAVAMDHAGLVALERQMAALRADLEAQHALMVEQARTLSALETENAGLRKEVAEMREGMDAERVAKAAPASKKTAAPAKPRRHRTHGGYELFD